jgi:hypothetical protein
MEKDYFVYVYILLRILLASFLMYEYIFMFVIKETYILNMKQEYNISWALSTCFMVNEFNNVNVSVRKKENKQFAE